MQNQIRQLSLNKKILHAMQNKEKHLNRLTPNAAKIQKVINDCEKYRSRLIGYCRQYFACEPEDAEDCVQDAYTALLEALQNGTEIQNPYAWLYKVTMNCKNKTLRDKIRRNELDFADNEEKERAMEQAAIHTPDLLDLAVTDETIEQRAVKILAALNEKERALYTAYYVEKKNLKEIGQMLGISHAAARKRHSELKKKITRMVKEFEKE